ncbi:MAG: outer membrane protein OmpA-like peptidoglycan-associated protein [Arcticibacterium sp.]|jgi:outer membrane protein OmpA-like peptidoglycan-associated protein
MKKLLFILLIPLSFQSVGQEPKEILRSIYFGGGSNYIDAEQRESLLELINTIPNLETYDISITSHTDNIGSREFNLYLSQMRSQSVVNQLIRFSVPPESIKYKDFGKDAPVYDNKTWEGRFRNRRVDILFTPTLL